MKKELVLEKFDFSLDMVFFYASIVYNMGGR